jgi:hypothetical protein
MGRISTDAIMLLFPIGREGAKLFPLRLPPVPAVKGRKNGKTIKINFLSAVGAFSGRTSC